MTRDEFLETLSKANEGEFHFSQGEASRNAEDALLGPVIGAQTILNQEREIATLTEKVTRLCHAYGNLLIATHDKDKEITQLREVVALFLRQMNKYGNWDDGCFYYSGVCASELQEAISLAEKVMKEHL